MQTARLYDVDTIQDQRARLYVGNRATRNQTVGDWFDSRPHGGDGATAIRSNGRTGIYYRSSRYNLNQDIYKKLHEVTHLAYPRVLPQGGTNLDQVLGTALGLERRKNSDGSQESWSNAVSRYFEGKCNPNELGTGLQPGTQGGHQ